MFAAGEDGTAVNCLVWKLLGNARIKHYFFRLHGRRSLLWANLTILVTQKFQVLPSLCLLSLVDDMHQSAYGKLRLDIHRFDCCHNNQIARKRA